MGSYNRLIFTPDRLNMKAFSIGKCERWNCHGPEMGPYFDSMIEENNAKVN